MDSSLTSLLLNNDSTSNNLSSVSSSYNAKATETQLLINTLNQNDSVSFDFSNSYKSLSIEAQKIIDAINAELKDYLPEGVQSLSEEEATSEATADRIVSAVTGLFASYQKSNSNLDDETMLNKFMDAVRSGVDTGYNDAYEILDGLGAFNYKGIEDDISKTLSLVHEKLDSFEKSMREQLGISSSDNQQSENITKNEILTQAGSSIK